jgi:hypothetical protein
MRHQYLLLILLYFTFACKIDNTRKKERQVSGRDMNIQVLIQHAQSYQTDVLNGNYSVFFVSKSPVVVKFDLTSAEKKQIIDKLYSLDLHKLKTENEISGILHFEDECFDMPKIYTNLIIKGDGYVNQFQIDESCTVFSREYSKIALKVKAFLDYVNSIIKVKPSVSNAPVSDIIYL